MKFIRNTLFSPKNKDIISFFNYKRGLFAGIDACTFA
jgi:hypothetical protein